MSRTRALPNVRSAHRSPRGAEPWMDDRRLEVKGSAMTVPAWSHREYQSPFPGNVEITPRLMNGTKGCAIGALKGRAD